MTVSAPRPRRFRLLSPRVSTVGLVALAVGAGFAGGRATLAASSQRPTVAPPAHVANIAPQYSTVSYSTIVDLAAPAGAMHAAVAAKTLSSVTFGYDVDRLFVRIDATGPVVELLEAGLEIYIRFIAPAGVRAAARVSRSQLQISLERQRDSAQWEPCHCLGVAGAAGSILEIAVPFACLRVSPHDHVTFVVGSSLGGVTPQQLPAHEPPTIRVPAPSTH